MLPKQKQVKILFLIVTVPIFLFPSLCFCADLRSLYESGVQAYNNGQYDQAIEYYQQIIKQAPQFAPAYIGIGLALKDKGGDIEEVLYYYKAAVEKDPTNIQALEQLGRLYFMMGRTSRAKEVFEAMLKINPHLAEIEMTLGWINLIGKKVNAAKAILYFQDVVKVAPSAGAYFGLGMAYFANNQRIKAIDMITQLNTMGQSDLAGKLEKAMRENRSIILDQNNNVSLGDVSEDDSPVQQDNGSTVENNSAQSTTDNNPPSDPKQIEQPSTTPPRGFKVRLRGKLDDI